MKMNWNAQINKYNEEDDEDTDTIIINEDLFEQREPEINEEEQIIQNEIKSDEFSFFTNNTKRNTIKEKKKNKNEQNLSNLKLKKNKNKKAERNDKNSKNNLNLIILKTDINKNINNYNMQNNNFNNVLILKKGGNISFKGDDDLKENKNEHGLNIVDKNNIKSNENDELVFHNYLENNKIVKNEKEISNSKSKNITDNNNSNYLLDNKRTKNRVKEKYSLKIDKNKYKRNFNNNIINQYKSKLKNNNLKKIIDYSNSNSNIKTNNSNTKINNSNSSRNYQEDINPKYKSAFVGNKKKLKYNNTNRDKENIKIKNIDLDVHKKNHLKNDYLRYYKQKNKNNTSIKKNNKNDNSTHLLYFHNKSQSHSQICMTSQKNSKYRNLNIEFKNKTQSENKGINKNKNYTNINTINERSKNNVIVLRKKKHEQEAEILKKILIKKINFQIEEIMRGKRNYYLNEKNKLFFLGFCDLLFELGFLHIKETEIVDISKINEHIDDLFTQPFTNRNLLSEEFLFNEQKLLICAWKTILNNFRLVKEFSELPNEDEEISMDDFKLFIFIIIGIFTGNNIKNFHNNIWNINKSYSPNKLSLKKDSNGKDIRNQIQTQNNKVQNHLFNSNINSPRENNFLKIKDFFNYFAELRKLYNLYKKDLKNINKKINIIKEFTFFPKTNKNNKQILKKFGTPLNFFERSELFKKRNAQKKAKLKLELSKRQLEECTFEPCQSSKSKSKSKNNRSLNNNKHKNPFEISNRLYYNYSKHKKSRTGKNTKNNSKNNNSESNTSKKNLTEENMNRSGGRECSRIFYKSIMNKKNKMKLYNLYDNRNLSNSKMHNSTNTNYNKIIKKEKKFSPDINKKYNKGMFSHSPLVNDELLNKRINKLRETNFKKFVTNYEKNNREIISDSIKKNKEILKQIINKDKGYMFNYLEKKTNKDTFDNFKDYNYYLNNENCKNKNIINEPLFIVEIKIKDNDAKMIEVYQDDIPEKLAYNFCIENLLGNESYEKILMIIKTKLDELNNGIINENINYSQNNENQKSNNNENINNYNCAKNGEEDPQNDSKIYDVNYENDNDNIDYFIDNLNINEDFKNNNIIKTKYTNNLFKDYNNIEKIDENNELSNDFQINFNDENIKENSQNKNNIFNDE